jgi:hypothetical protein
MCSKASELWQGLLFTICGENYGTARKLACGGPVSDITEDLWNKVGRADIRRHCGPVTPAKAD